MTAIGIGFLKLANNQFRPIADIENFKLNNKKAVIQSCLIQAIVKPRRIIYKSKHQWINK